jgi:hypothetical protein
MSKYAPVKKEHSLEESVSEVNLTVRDTDFLLKLIMRSQFDGTEVEQAHGVIVKLVDKHRRNLES